MSTTTDKVFGATVVQARHARGLKQGVLAQLVGRSGAWVSKIERSERQAIARDMRLALEDALDWPRDGLLLAPAPCPTDEQLHYRKQARALKRDKDRLTVLGGQLVRLVLTVETHCTLAAPVDEPRLVGDPERDAEAIRRQLGLRVDAPLANVVRVIEKFGGFVGAFRGDYGVDGFSWREDGRAYAMISVDTPASRQRWSLAHELGHLVYRHVGSGDRLEEEAHAFAGALLLPRAAMRAEFPSHRRNIDWARLRMLKRRWGVSLAALLRRARNLGLIDHALYSRSFKRMSQLGWRTREPDEFDVELPSLVPRALEAIANANRWSAEDVARKSAVPEDLLLTVSTASFCEPEAEVVPIHFGRKPVGTPQAGNGA